MQGKFIVFEGTDGAGKSTAIASVKNHLRQRDNDIVYVQDPGGTAIGQSLRKVLLNPEFIEMTPLTELLLYSASRSQLVCEKILPALESGKTVISDRYIYSTLAYQGAALKLNKETLSTIVHAGANQLFPDHIIFLDLPAEIGLSRISGSKDRIEEKGLSYMRAVRECYHQELAQLSNDKVTIINAESSIEELTSKVLECIDDLL